MLAEAADEEGAADAEEDQETPAAASADDEEAAGVPPVMEEELDVHEPEHESFARDDAQLRFGFACFAIWPLSSFLNLFHRSRSRGEAASR